MASTYTPIASATSNNNSTITFDNIPGSYTDLVLIIDGALSGSAVKYVQFNSDNGSNYSCTTLLGDGTTTSSGKYTTAWIDVFNAQTSNFMTIVNFMNYSNSTTYKTYLSRHSSAGKSSEAIVGVWRSTAAITKIDIKTSSNNFGTSTFALYGIKAA